jgi:hypothetical protein
MMGAAAPLLLLLLLQEKEHFQAGPRGIHCT